MAVAKIWVFAEADGDKPTTATLELLTKARELGDTRRGGLRRCRTPTRSRPALGEHGATKVYVVDPGDGLPGRRRRRRARDARRASTRPTSSCSRRATTAATRSRACR